MRAARRAARVFKRVSVLGDISPFWVSEGGLEHPLPGMHADKSEDWAMLTRRKRSGRPTGGRRRHADPSAPMSQK